MKHFHYVRSSAFALYGVRLSLNRLTHFVPAEMSALWYEQYLLPLCLLGHLTLLLLAFHRFLEPHKRFTLKMNHEVRRSLLVPNQLRTTCATGGPGSSVGIATGYGLDGPGSNPGVDEICRICPALGPTQPPVQWVPGLSRL